MYKRGGSLIDATKNSIWYDDNMYVINHVYIYDQTRKRFLIHNFFWWSMKKITWSCNKFGAVDNRAKCWPFFFIRRRKHQHEQRRKNYDWPTKWLIWESSQVTTNSKRVNCGARSLLLFLCEAVLQAIFAVGLFLSSVHSGCNINSSEITSNVSSIIMSVKPMFALGTKRQKLMGKSS